MGRPFGSGELRHVRPTAPARPFFRGAVRWFAALAAAAALLAAALPAVRARAAVWLAPRRPEVPPAAANPVPPPAGLGRLLAQAPVVRAFGWTVRAGRPLFAANVRLAVPDGSMVVAMAAGRVAAIGDDPGGDGLYVLVDQARGWAALYGDCAGVLVPSGRRVVRGEALCTAGRSGPPGRGHLILGLLFHGDPVNPQPYLAR